MKPTASLPTPGPLPVAAPPAVVAPDAAAVAKGYGKFAGRRSADVMISMIDDFKKMMPTGLRFTIINVIAEVLEPLPL